LKSRADFHLQQLQDSIAIQELVTALELQKRSGDNKMHYTTDLLTHLYINAGKLKEALECAIASLDYCRKANDTVYVLTFYQRLGDVYRYMKNVKESFYYYQRALSVMDHSNSLRYLAIFFLSEMGECLNDEGKSQEALDFFLREIKNYPPIDGLSQLIADRAFLDRYFSVNKFKETEKYLLKILATDKEIGKPYGSLLHVYTIGASLYYQLRQYDKASLYVDTAYTMAMQLGSSTELMKNCLTRYKLALIKEDYKNALKYFEEYKKHSDTYQQEAAERRFIELSVKYETDQKNSQLQFLTTQTKLNEATIKQGTTQRNFMIAASVLLLLLLLLIFNRYRVKQRANKQLQDKQDEINWQNQQLEKMVVDEKKITAEKDKLLQEKEWLMKEINHRVKNNLQVVMSLLNTQSAYLQDEAALNAIQESRHRVHAISLIHRKLYQSDQQLTTIDMVTYIKDVTEYLADSLDMQSRITFGLFIDPIELDVTQAVPVGLIINEAVTNAVKYAFPQSSQSQINISMYKKDNGVIELMIRDNGVGLPPGYDWQQSESLGMSLIHGLSRQLDGRFDLIQQDGITIKITFEPAKSLK
jgi:two-component system, sensor histidine kinase PdtaS